MADEPIPSAEVSRSELKQATFSSLRWVTIARITAELLSLAAGILLAHLVPPADFGRVAIAIVVSELGLALANQGAGSVLVQRKTLDRAHVESAAMLALIVGVILTLLTVFVLPFATTPLFGEPTTELFRLLSPVFVIAAVGTIPLALLERQLNFRKISMIEISGVLAGAIASVGLALAGLNAEAYVIGSLAGLVVWAGLLVLLGPSTMPRWRPRQMREIASFGLPAAAASMAMVGYGNVDYLILGAKLSPAQVGFYYRAYTLGVQYETKISNIVSRIAFPIYSRTEDLDHLRRLRSRVIRVNAVVIYPLLALFIALAPELVPWVFGAQWAPAVLPAQILTVAGMARMINNQTPSLVLAAGKPRTLLGFNLYRLATLAVVVLLTAPYGLTAVCVAVATFQVATLIGSHRFMLARIAGLTVRQLAVDIGPATLSSAIMLVAAFPLAHALNAQGISNPLTAALVTAVAGPLYVLTLRVLSPASWDDLLLLARRVLPRVGRRQPAPPVNLDGSAAPSS